MDTNRVVMKEKCYTVGLPGEQLKSSIFMGPIYYQRIKSWWRIKCIFGNGTGPNVDCASRQPDEPTMVDCASEMERDSILSHGISNFLSESMMKRSDEYRVQINETTGKIDYTDNDEPKCEIQLPYAMKMLLQEL